MSNLEIPPEYNWAQIEVILYALENIDISMWDEGTPPRDMSEELHKMIKELEA